MNSADGPVLAVDVSALISMTHDDNYSQLHSVVVSGESLDDIDHLIGREVTLLSDLYNNIISIVLGKY